MVYDQDFPKFAGRVLRLTAGLAALAGAVCFLFWGGEAASGVIAGALLQIGFLWFLLAVYRKRRAAGESEAEIGRTLVGLTTARLFLEIGACVLAALVMPRSLWGFLTGLLSLMVATILDKIISVIKK